MAKAAAKAPAPRKALGEKLASSLNQKPKVPATTQKATEKAPLKKVKKTITKPDPKAKPVKVSAGEPPVYLSEITLDGEEDGTIEVYDDCRTIRTKIRALLATGVKPSHFLKWCGGITYNTYTRFMRASGIMEGIMSGLYYAAYVFFEKKRIAEGKKKTELRLRQEEAFPYGRDLSHDPSRTSYITTVGSYITFDDLGRIVVHRTR